MTEAAIRHELGPLAVQLHATHEPAAIVVWQSDTTDSVIENNVFYRGAVRLGIGDCQGIDSGVVGDRHVLRPNLFFGPGRTSIGGESRHNTVSANVEGTDPLFVNADRFGYRLRKDSPARDPTGLPQAGAPPGVGQATSP